ncbi:hypothetical protein Mal15_15760 [Stieleria maiorica]|uniref:Uncharacterized protein n=1 Tax=Stieleria maiorica TaxID=2795974 RepID=A0A5B9MBB8_9BACT|nr:hypothetical protein Mal15_15760 [Stieleria maiorica]
MPEWPENLLSLTLLSGGVVAALGLVALVTYMAFFQKP